MNRSTHSRTKFTLLLTTLLGSILLASCNAQNDMALNSVSGDSPNSQVSQSASKPAGNISTKQQATTPESTQTENPVPQSPPQLIKTAELSLVVKSLEDTVKKVSTIVKQQQGDILGLEDNKPQNLGSRHTASMQIRVPQANLETTLDTLAKLGTVQRRNLHAEDVTTQLVDIQARLKTLRQTENSLLQILKRSGSIGDVLKVTQELSKVRQSIEQIDAQQKSLTTRVAYSNINLQLEAAVSSQTPQQPLGIQIQDAWNNSSQSVGEFSTNLMRLFIWLVAYSPYFLLFGGATWLAFTRLKKKQQKRVTKSSDSNLDTSR
jgi:hypothetical protein